MASTLSRVADVTMNEPITLYNNGYNDDNNYNE